MRKRLFPMGLIALLFTTTPLLAGGIELTPYVGYRAGGEFEDTDSFFSIDLEVEDGASAGFILGIELTRTLQVELLWDHQESTLIEQGFFSDDEILFDLDVDYYHVGILYQWSPGQLRPFVTASIGATEFSPVGDLTSETRPSVAFGGGVKIMANEHFGVRLEGRGFATLVNENDDEFICDYDYCYETDGDDYFTQFEALAGLVFHF